MSGYDLMSALNHIDPSSLHYDDWLKVGQSLHHEGFGVDEWRSWTAQDARPDHAHRLQKLEYKWGTFGHNAGQPVTGGTLVAIAKDHGWHGAWLDDDGREHHAMTWDSPIGGSEDEPAMIDPASIGDDAEEVAPLFEAGHEVEELRSFLAALFEPDEHIGYVTECEYDEEKDKWQPCRRGVYSRTMGDVYDAVYKGGIENGLSCTINAEAGAFVRINPLDGKGVSNTNVTAFRHALVESDTMTKGKFAAIVKQLNLPVVALVDSGNKSLHAIVRIDATDDKQYRERVELLYSRCKKNGIDVDEANKNPSRMTRMPGVMRNGNRQFLAGLSQGAGDWEEWNAWYEDATDELPDTVSLDKMLGDNLPPLKPALIDGLLRVGHKMLVSGPSKAGKSFALIALCIAFAEGLTWFGMKCRQSRVMYVNLELDSDSCFNRFADMYGALGIDPSNASKIDVWNLRGKSEPMAKLLPKLVRRALKHETQVVVIDPIYKVMVGDENSAGDMAQFANLFDELCDKACVSAIYCHHHSKGFQGDKRSIDRASGSGVFGRDPDAILDLVELDVEDPLRWKRVQDAACDECERTVADAGGMAEWMALPEVTRRLEKNALLAACEMLDNEDGEALKERCDKIKARQDGLSAWRIDATLREFPRFSPVSAWFDWPLHVVDKSLDSCKELGAAEQPSVKRSGGGGKQRKPDTRKEPPNADQAKAYAEINDALEKAVRYCAEDGVEPTRRAIQKRIPDVAGKPPTYKQVCNWTDANKSWCEWVPGDVVKDSARSEKAIVKRAAGVPSKEK